MKKTTTTSKLGLKQETVRALTPNEIRGLAGGLMPTPPYSDYRSSYPMHCCHGPVTTG